MLVWYAADFKTNCKLQMIRNRKSATAYANSKLANTKIFFFTVAAHVNNIQGSCFASGIRLSVINAK